MRFPFALILIIQSFFHFLGFVHAFDYHRFATLPEIFPALGVSWLLTSLVFLSAAIAILFQKNFWGVAALAGVLLSQMLVYSVWEEALVLTLLNLIIIIPACLSIGYYSFENTYLEDVKGNLDRTKHLKADTLLEKDLEELPPAIQRYLHYTGAVNGPKLHNLRVVYAGRMRSKKRDWFPFTTIQYSFFDEPTRLSFMRTKIKHMMVPIYSNFIGPSATFEVRLFGIFTWRKESGEKIDRSETLTLFHDMCLWAPASLIDQRIKWLKHNDHEVEAKFSNHGITVRATLHFDYEGKLINFTTKDRITLEEKRQIPFSSPVTEYQHVDNLNIPIRGKGIWHYPEGDFEFFEYDLKRVHWNVTN